MGIQDFVARLQPGCSLQPLAYTPHEHYYMQAQVPQHMQEQLRLGELLQQIEAAATTAAGAHLQNAARFSNVNCSRDAVQQQQQSARLCFSQEPRIWVSPAGAVSPLHYDASNSFLLQVHGYKRMLFVSPEQLYRLYCYPDTHMLRRRSVAGGTASLVECMVALSTPSAMHASCIVNRCSGCFAMACRVTINKLSRSSACSQAACFPDRQCTAYRLVACCAAAECAYLVVSHSHV